MVFRERSISYYTRKFSPPTGGFFLAPAEGGRAFSGPKVIFGGRRNGRTDERITVLRELDCFRDIAITFR